MAYTTIDKPTDYFNTKLYTGNGSTQSITGVGFQPDFIWLKERSSTGNHKLNDVIRGTNKYLSSNLSDAEDTTGSGIQSYDSDGFSISNATDINDNTETYVAWNWYTGATASSNTDGSITSSVSANTTAGFSIVSYTGTGANATVGHGLGTSDIGAIIFKNRSDVEGWKFYHKNLGATKNLNFNETGASQTQSGAFNDTEPTSSVFSVGTFNSTNGSSDSMLAYCFAEKKGYSKFGSYTGNGSADGTFVYTGFKPAWVMVKRTDSTGQWGIADNKRGVAPSGEFLFAESSGSTNSAPNNFDFLSNGFKSRADYAANNTSSATYIYMAFAENPFVTSTGIPCTAR
jgi:hypothetical protein